MPLSLEINMIAGADALVIAEGRTEAPQLAWRRGPVGVQEQGMFTFGAPQEPGKPCLLRSESNQEGALVYSIPRPTMPRPASPGAKRRTQERYRQAKVTKCGGMDCRVSEHPIVPRKRGNRPEGPRGGKGVPEIRNFLRERCRIYQGPSPSQRDKRR